MWVSGVVLWWPGIRRMARGFQVRRGKGACKLDYDLHNVVGIALLPLLAMPVLGLIWLARRRDVLAGG